MSGTLMDGGGQDQVGHGVQPGHGGDQVQMHAQQGGEGLNLSSLLGIGQQGHHSFLSHLLGLDQNAHHNMGHAQGPTHASQMPGWSQAMQGIKLSHFVSGIYFSPANWLFTLFLFFVSWLFVVYFIRHHEPFANFVLGANTVQSSTAQYDRNLIAGCNVALPLRTSARMTLWAPSPPVVDRPVPPGSAGAFERAALPASATNVDAFGAPRTISAVPAYGTVAPPAMSIKVSSPPTARTAPYLVPPPPPMPLNSFSANPVTSSSLAPPPPPTPIERAYSTPITNVPVQEQTGTRVRSIVTR